MNLRKVEKEVSKLKDNLRKLTVTPKKNEMKTIKKEVKKRRDEREWFEQTAIEVTK